MISDARLMGLFTGSNRPYLLVLDDGTCHQFRARSLRDARHIAREFVARLAQGREIVSVTRKEKDMSDLGTHYCGTACDPPHRLDVWSEQAIRADERAKVIAENNAILPATIAAEIADLRAKEIQGNCPACGRKGLFIGDGGYLTCSQVDCPQPDVFDYYADLRASEFEKAYEDVITRCRRDGNTGMVLADLRAKVKALPRVTDDYYREAVLLADVLAAIDARGTS